MDWKSSHKTCRFQWALNRHTHTHDSRDDHLQILHRGVLGSFPLFTYRIERFRFPVNDYLFPIEAKDLSASCEIWSCRKRHNGATLVFYGWGREMRSKLGFFCCYFIQFYVPPFVFRTLCHVALHFRFPFWYPRNCRLSDCYGPGGTGSRFARFLPFRRLFHSANKCYFPQPFLVLFNTYISIVYFRSEIFPSLIWSFPCTPYKKIILWSPSVAIFRGILATEALVRMSIFRQVGFSFV